MEINMSNKNAKSLVVINDLRLLELLNSYPFLLSARVRPFRDKDYEEWAWDCITTAFNMSYTDLTSPFTAEELQWRWDILRPVLGSLSKANGQIPEILYRIIVKVHDLMKAQPLTNNEHLTSVQKFVLEQSDFVGLLSKRDRRNLEMEIMDTILQAERRQRMCTNMTSEQKDNVQHEYEDFLKTIRVKELPSPNVQTQRPTIINNPHTNIVISRVSSAHELQPLSTNNDEMASPGPYIKSEPPDEPTVDAIGESNGGDKFESYYVPVKSAKYYVRNVKVRIKRIDLEDYKPLSLIAKYLNAK